MIFGRTYSKTVIWQNDVTSAPAAPAGGPLAKHFTSRPRPPAVPRNVVITRIGDPNAAPIIAPITAAPVLAQPQQPKPFRGQTIVGAAAADIYFSAPCIATPQPPRPTLSTSVVQTPSGPRFGEMPPAPFLITRPAQASPGVEIVYRQAQDGATVNTSGPTPTTLIVTSPRPAAPLPEVMTLATVPAAAASPIVRPVVVAQRTIPRPGRGRIFRTPLAAVVVGPPTAPYVKVPTLLALEAHSASIALGVHESGIGLAAHISGVALVAHGTGLVLDAHGSRLTLEP